MSRRTIPFLFSLLLLLLLHAACTDEGPSADCAVDAGACVRTVDGTTVAFAITPQPVKAMRELRFSVLLLRATGPVKHASVAVDLSMPGMNMGENIVKLAPGPGGRYEGTGVIVRCPSGKTLWKASVIIAEGDRVRTAEFLFDAP